MVKRKRTIEETICDICNQPETYRYRKCAVCNKDVCQNCNIELYEKKKNQQSQSVQSYTFSSNLILPLLSSDDYKYLTTMCRTCFNIFIELSKKPTIIKAYEQLQETKK